MKHIIVPFVPNPNDRCVPATIAMVLAHFMPERHFTTSEVEVFCGYKEGGGSWQTACMLSLAKLGFQVHWIEDFDHRAFIADPITYLASILDPEALKWQIDHGDLSLEAQRMEEYLASGLPLERRKGTHADIKRFLDDGWLVRIEVNAQPLHHKPGYDGHSVLAVGYSDQEIIMHNPDSQNGNDPDQHVSWDVFDQAWKEFGGSYSLYAFKK